MNKNSLSILLVSITAFVLCACAGGVRKPVSTAGVSGSDTSIGVLYQTSHCEKMSRGGFSLIDDAVVLEDLLIPQGEALAKEVLSRVDFNRRQVLVVDFGAAPTGGSTSGALLSDAVQRSGRTGVVRIELPKVVKADKRQIQKLMHHCQLYSLPRGFESIEVRSQFDDLLITF